MVNALIVKELKAGQTECTETDKRFDEVPFLFNLVFYDFFSC